MFFIFAEYIKNTYIKNLYTQIVEVAKVVKIIPDIEVGIKSDMQLIKDGYEWEIKIPDYFSSQEELDKLV
jgi:hypothetical protein